MQYEPSLFIHDTATGGKREFTPVDPGRVTMYVCGPTVYDVPHIGNVRTAVAFDVLRRVLKSLYGASAVIYARNYTDIDDKIIQRANDLGVEIGELTQTTVSQYEDAMIALNVLTPTMTPHATGFVPEMLSIITHLVEAGHAYVTDGHVLFDVASSKAASLVPNLTPQAGARVAVEDYKRDPRDFVLWKPAKDGEPFWESQFGPGRPGWHIECSAMISARLGETIDIHGGGQDLIFPHHECEKHQSETANGAPLANFWLHSGMLTVDGQKMSKSLGNFITVPQVLERYDGEVLRYFFLSGSYRSNLDFTWEKLDEAKKSLDRLYRALLEVNSAGEPDETIDSAVLANLCDDLNTPIALATMHKQADAVFKKEFPPAYTKRFLLSSGEFLGLLQRDPSEWFRGSDDSSEIAALVKQRNDHRAAKQWASADEIRRTLVDMGVVLEDNGAETTWKLA